MNCRELDTILIEKGQGAALDVPGGPEHLRSCARCRGIAGLLDRSEAVEAVDPHILETLKAAILPQLRPVRPLAPTWVWAASLVLLAAAIALTGAFLLGMDGLQTLTGTERAMIFSIAGLTAGITGNALAGQMSPGSKRPISAWGLLVVTSISFGGAFILLFRGYASEHFVSGGLRCLLTGLCFALTTAILVTVILRRGFFIDRVAKGITAGTFAGLTGISVLELHCPNLNVPHVIVWHLFVLVLSGVSGWLLSRVKFA